MDPFTVVIGGGMLALVIALLAIGKWYPGSGADVIDWKPTRSVEAEAEMEMQDLEDMLEAANRRRRRRGEPELTEADLHARVASDRREQEQMRSGLREEQDLDELLEATNARRRRRGEPELTVEELRAELGGG